MLPAGAFAKARPWNLWLEDRALLVGAGWGMNLLDDGRTVITDTNRVRFQPSNVGPSSADADNLPSSVSRSLPSVGE
ncbi:hypothetical protein [Streptomyces sp. NPDC056682]|uniref:hypothetical protein n=1 Tax=Streptomyces sp. NPDC056682 TaxID=3345909 RepID=UPI00369402D0